ncbi:hypothetical protein [Pontibacillus litoralis]|uniref:Uncharacterized protein n=1 Tax=Pontibacillus litoralis JSM 072002 TaxID=1385512 RepID=A0A0A5FWB4_9BACI|nr:hypothetical protein [Pontibacillus litoralis]KGX85056.1 hypothetical protein N784_11210 [Pontibacillus litoralis JSM 072002]
MTKILFVCILTACVLLSFDFQLNKGNIEDVTYNDSQNNLLLVQDETPDPWGIVPPNIKVNIKG